MQSSALPLFHLPGLRALSGHVRTHLLTNNTVTSRGICPYLGPFFIILFCSFLYKLTASERAFRCDRWYLDNFFPATVSSCLYRLLSRLGSARIPLRITVNSEVFADSGGSRQGWLGVFFFPLSISSPWLEYGPPPSTAPWNPPLSQSAILLLCK